VKGVALAEIGKFADAVTPVTMASPPASTTMPSPSSAPVPPTYVE
jgi:hypothetical protein